MRRLIRLARHARALLRIRLLEIRLHDLSLAADRCRARDERIERQRRLLQRELVHARIRLNEFLKPGDRRTWRVA